MNMKIDSYMRLCPLPMALVYNDHEHEDIQLYEVVSSDYGPGVWRP